MKVLILLVAVIACSLAAPHPPESFANNINYHFYCRRNPRGINVHLNQITAQSLSNIFDPSLETIVLIHGWQDNYGAESNTEVRTALLRSFNVNVIKVDWGHLAGQLYLSARNSVPGVGRAAADMLRRINQLFNYNFNRVTVIGFSLGAHVAGNLGAALNGRVGQIVGLDPAGPFINARDTNYCLDPTDAIYVQVIHTNSDLLGMLDAIGHSDYYPNGGGVQPGCSGTLTNSCSHNRAWAYLAESLASARFVSRQCTRAEFNAGRCNGGSSVMGGLRLDQRARGSYYLNVNNAAPFARG